QSLGAGKNDSLLKPHNHSAKTLGILDTLEYLERSSISDSLRIRKLSSLACRANSINDSILFKKLNKEVLRLARKTADTFGLADASWNYGTYYIDREVYDSA